MRILYYNWVNFDDIEKQGGGVTVYQKNIIDKLTLLDDIEIVFFSSGTKYSLINTNKQYMKYDHRYNDVECYSLYNSKVLAPGYLSFYNKHTVYESEAVDVLEKFIHKTGPYDVIHFNNLEGIPVEVVKLKQVFKTTKFIFSMHNYYPLCPNVHLFYQDKSNCIDYENGKKCMECMFDIPGPQSMIKKYQLKPVLPVVTKIVSIDKIRKIYSIVKKISTIGRKNKKKESSEDSEALNLGDQDYLKNRREEIVDLINNNIDEVLVVSNRVGEIAQNYGIDANKIKTSYIGTKHAEIFDLHQKKMDFNSDSLSILYLGYMRRDKGFYFFLDAMEKMPQEIADKINIIIAARNTDHEAYDRIMQLKGKYKKVQYYDGYTHETLPKLFEDTDITVVPVLWEDNLPQIAIESVCYGVPLFTSELGGAKELGNNDDFVYDSGSYESFYSKLSKIVFKEVLLKSFWSNLKKPVTMEEHISELLTIYKTPLRIEEDFHENS